MVSTSQGSHKEEMSECVQRVWTACGIEQVLSKHDHPLPAQHILSFWVPQGHLEQNLSPSWHRQSVILLYLLLHKISGFLNKGSHRSSQKKFNPPIYKVRQWIFFFLWYISFRGQIRFENILTIVLSRGIKLFKHQIVLQFHLFFKIEFQSLTKWKNVYRAPTMYKVCSRLWECSDE